MKKSKKRRSPPVDVVSVKESSGSDDRNGKAVPSISIPSRREKWLIAILCLVAAVRIFFLCTVFPFFNNVDEEHHFDLIWKYSRSQPIFETDRVNAEVLRIWYLFDSPEFLERPEDWSKFGSPPFSQPGVMRAQKLRTVMASDVTNMEEYSPPLYYFLAGKWLAIGRAMGLRDGSLLYWSRFLDIPLYIIFIIIAYGLARVIPYRSDAMVFSLPLLVAFMPQSVFYSLNSDVLTPIPAGIAFLLIIRNVLGMNLSLWHYAALGLCVAAALLTKLSNIPLLFMVILFLGAKVISTGRAGISRLGVVKASVFCICSLTPVAIWTANNFLKIGDWTGTSHKVELLGWTYKPVSSLLSHPIFSFSGISYFLQRIFQTFWEGELTWGNKPLTIDYMNYFYPVLTLLALLVTFVSVTRKSSNPRERTMVAISLAGIASALSYLAILSLMYDFGSCPYPSSAQPFFVSGRLILSVMFPLLFCVTWAVDYLAALCWKGERPVGIFVIIGICALMTISQIYLVLEPSRSPYNFFHIPLGAIN